MAATEKDESQLAIARTLKNIPWCDDYEKMISGMLYVFVYFLAMMSITPSKRIEQSGEGRTPNTNCL